MSPSSLKRRRIRTGSNAKKVADKLEAAGQLRDAEAIRIIVHQHSEAIRHLEELTGPSHERS